MSVLASAHAEYGAVTWLEGAGTETAQVRFAEWDSMFESKWSSSEQVAQGKILDLAVSADSGHPLFVWTEDQPAGIEVRATLLRNSVLKDWSPVRVIGPADPRPVSDLVASVRTYPGWMAQAVWVRGSGQSAEIQSAVTPDAYQHDFDIWHPMVRLATGEVSRPDIVSNRGGRTAAVWLEGPAGATRVMARQNPSATTGTWGPATPLTVVEAGSSSTPVVRDSRSYQNTNDSPFVAVWAQDDAGTGRHRLMEATLTTAAVSAPQSVVERPDPIRIVHVPEDTSAAGIPVVWLEGGRMASLERSKTDDTWARMGVVDVPAGASTIQADTDMVGDVAAIWIRPDAGKRLESALLDRGRPLLLGTSDEEGAVDATKPIPFTIKGYDALSSFTGVWDFGDGTTAEGLSVEHTYQYGGVYNVTGRLRDAAGNLSKDAIEWVMTIPGPPRPSGTSPASGTSPTSGASPKSGTSPTSSTTTPPAAAAPTNLWYMVAMRMPVPQKEAVIRARRVYVRAPITLRPGKKCTGRVTATMGRGATLRKGTLKLTKGVFNARNRCLAVGFITPARAPKAGQPVTIKGLTIATRVVRVKA